VNKKERKKRNLKGNLRQQEGENWSSLAAVSRPTAQVAKVAILGRNFEQRALLLSPTEWETSQTIPRRNQGQDQEI
jgi:hypothetical protein